MCSISYFVIKRRSANHSWRSHCRGKSWNFISLIILPWFELLLPNFTRRCHSLGVYFAITYICESVINFLLSRKGNFTALIIPPYVSSLRPFINLVLYPWDSLKVMGVSFEAWTDGFHQRLYSSKCPSLDNLKIFLWFCGGDEGASCPRHDDEICVPPGNLFTALIERTQLFRAAFELGRH